MTASKAALATLVLALGLAAGCGGDEGGESTSGEETTSESGASAESFESSTEAICARFRDDVLAGLIPLNRKLEQRDISPREFAQDEQLLSSTTESIEADVLPAYEAFIDDMGELEPPAENADDFNRVLAAYESAFDDYAANPISVVDPDADLAIEQAQAETGFSLCSR